MRSYRAAVAAVLGSALVVAMLSTPVLAAEQGRIVVVNGRAGSNAEVCLNGKEVRSSLRYGQHAVRMANAGDKTLQFRNSRRGTCRGELLGQTTIALVVGGDWVVVLTRFAPNKTLVMDAAPANGVATVVRHAADIGPAGFKYVLPGTGGTPWSPVVDVPFVKGQSGRGGTVPEGIVFWAHQPPEQGPIAGPITVVNRPGTRSELILIGSGLGNVRFKLFSLPHLEP